MSAATEYAPSAANAEERDAKIYEMHRLITHVEINGFRLPWREMRETLQAIQVCATEALRAHAGRTHGGDQPTVDELFGTGDPQ